MRKPDINRVEKAREHLKAAVTILNSIKWEKVSNMEYEFVMKAKEKIRDADYPLLDIISLQES